MAYSNFAQWDGSFEIKGTKRPDRGTTGTERNKEIESEGLASPWKKKNKELCSSKGKRTKALRGKGVLIQNPKGETSKENSVRGREESRGVPENYAGGMV